MAPARRDGPGLRPALAAALLAALALAAPAAAQDSGDAALPFAVDLPDGFAVEQRSRPEFDYFQISRDGAEWIGVRAGCCAQFPYYDGDRVDFGDSSYVTRRVDGASRTVEYLHRYGGEGWSSELHVWLNQGARQDWDLARTIAESIRPLPDAGPPDDSPSD